MTDAQLHAQLYTAIVSASATMITAIVALILNQRGFTLLSKRIDDTNANFNQRFADVNSRLDRIDARMDRFEGDLKEFFKVQAEHDKRIQRLEDNK